MLTLTGVLMLAHANTPSIDDHMKPLEWSHRPLLVFGKNTAAIASLATQVEASRAAFAERDQVSITITSEGVERDGEAWGQSKLSAAFRQHYNVDPASPTAVLVAKDGTVKLHEPLPVELEAIFALIDAMPMRQREMRAAADTP